MAEDRRKPIKVSYGTSPGSLVIHHWGVVEPVIIWNPQDALQFVLDLTESYKKAWPEA